MSFLKKIKAQVDSRIRGDGNQLFFKRYVTKLRGDDIYAEAVVRDGPEDVGVETAAYREEDRLVVRCECEDFLEGGDVCKHIWAMLMAAAGKKLLASEGDKGNLFIHIDEDFDGDEAYLDDDDDEDDDLFEQRSWREPPRRKTATRPRPKVQAPKPAPVPGWQKQLQALQQQISKPVGQLSRWKIGRELLYVVELPESVKNKKLFLTVPYRERKQNGDWGKPKYESFDVTAVPQLADPNDRKIMSLLMGGQAAYGGYYSPYSYSSGCRYFVSEGLAETLLPLVAGTGRGYVRAEANDELTPLVFDAGDPWTFHLQCTLVGQSYQIAGRLRRGEETAELSQALLLLPGFVVWKDRIARLTVGPEEMHWLEHFRTKPSLKFPVDQKDAWLKEFLRLPHLPRLHMPEDLQFEEIQGQPRPRLLIVPSKDSWAKNVVHGQLSFDYAGNVVASEQQGPVYHPEERRLIRRDGQAELEAHERLLKAGFHRNAYDQARMELNIRHMSKVVAKLLGEGWHVEAEGKLFRQPGKIDIEVVTGIDWFELHGQVQFENTSIGLPALLQALKQGEKTVVLGDGSVGMLPEDWLKKYGLLAGLGKAEDGHLKFGRNQVGLLDALLAAQPEARFDQAFAQVRDELRSFAGIQPADPKGDFHGDLRGYQREGLGWLHFLNRFGFGGCLADDMGLGKTVQVLALLEERRQSFVAGQRPRPSLVVVPRSLVFNWKAEAVRFAPSLRVLDHTDLGRVKPGEHFEDYDLVLTTYGILRRDVLEFKDCNFDYCILDEAQAVKNAKSESAKACRLVQARHRLAVTGTPVENHLGELWSLFEFLNPGMLGQASVFQLAGVGARSPEPETRDLLAKALRPFLLRRTKEQVAKDLPQKTEQTLFAEMEPEQRKLYNELRDHFRLSLLNRIEKEGMAKAKILILEALLRLRQAACHPGLIDRNRAGDGSAKLDLLLPQLKEVLEEGHKALVFSQFTTMLSIVKQRLDQDKIPYEYLDGRTRNREEKVQRFQTDPDCKLFLISLKAGGVGLNLTAAEYVFLLDPWWNPAVEAQAIDRTHRIGQTNPVFAYRLIVKDTVEEKVLELQQQKRALADAILSCDNSLIRTLGKDDLEMLLS